MADCSAAPQAPAAPCGQHDVRVELSLPDYVLDFTSRRRNNMYGVRAHADAHDVFRFALHLMYGVTTVDDLQPHMLLPFLQMVRYLGMEHRVSREAAVAAAARNAPQFTAHYDEGGAFVAVESAVAPGRTMRAKYRMSHAGRNVEGTCMSDRCIACEQRSIFARHVRLYAEYVLGSGEPFADDDACNIVAAWPSFDSCNDAYPPFARRAPFVLLASGRRVAISDATRGILDAAASHIVDRYRCIYEDDGNDACA